MAIWLKSFLAACQVFAALWKAYREFSSAVEQDGSGNAKKKAVFGLLGGVFEVCEKFTVDTPLEGADISAFAEKVWATWESFCVLTGKFKTPSVPESPVA